MFLQHQYGANSGECDLVRTDMFRERGGKHFPSLPCEAEAEEDRRLALILRMFRHEQVTHDLFGCNDGVIGIRL